MQHKIPLLYKNGMQLLLTPSILALQCDALCVCFLGKRHAEESHDDAVNLFKTIKLGDKAINTNANRIIRILSIKNMAEYEERLVYRVEAEKVLKDCERFLEYVKKELP